MPQQLTKVTAILKCLDAYLDQIIAASLPIPNVLILQLVILMQKKKLTAKRLRHRLEEGQNALTAMVLRAAMSNNARISWLQRIRPIAQLDWLGVSTKLQTFATLWIQVAHIPPAQARTRRKRWIAQLLKMPPPTQSPVGTQTMNNSAGLLCAQTLQQQQIKPPAIQLQPHLDLPASIGRRTLALPTVILVLTLLSELQAPIRKHTAKLWQLQLRMGLNAHIRVEPLARLLHVQI